MKCSLRYFVVDKIADECRQHCRDVIAYEDDVVTFDGFFPCPKFHRSEGVGIVTDGKHAFAISHDVDRHAFQGEPSCFIISRRRRVSRVFFR